MNYRRIGKMTDRMTKEEAVSKRGRQTQRFRHTERQEKCIKDTNIDRNSSKTVVRQKRKVKKEKRSK